MPEADAPTIFPDGISRVDPTSARYHALSRKMGFEGAPELVVEYRQGYPGLGMPLLVIGVVLAAAHFIIEDTRPFLALSGFIFLVGLYVLFATRYHVSWYAFARGRLHVRLARRQGMTHDDLVLDKPGIQSADLLSLGYGRYARYRVVAHLRNRETTVVMDRDSSIERAKWLNEKISQWLREDAE